MMRPSLVGVVSPARSRIRHPRGVKDDEANQKTGSPHQASLTATPTRDDDGMWQTRDDEKPSLRGAVGDEATQLNKFREASIIKIWDMQKTILPAVYITASQRNGTLYTGVSSNLPQRIWQHKNEFFKGFSLKYGCKLLVFYELHETMESAISREKQIKSGSRKKKLTLIETINPDWRDLYEDII